MKKTLTALVSATLCLTGCFSVERATSEVTGEEHILVSNYGWSLFGSIPVCCGNADVDAFLPWAFFRNDVTMKKAQARLMEKVSASGKRVDDLVYRNNEKILFTFPLTEISIPIPYLICYREIQLSGVLK